MTFHPCVAQVSWPSASGGGWKGQANVGHVYHTCVSKYINTLVHCTGLSDDWLILGEDSWIYNLERLNSMLNSGLLKISGFQWFRRRVSLSV